MSTTYYVSPAGNDANAGTSSGAPWKTAAKVDAFSFNPGDQILFQRGGQWHENLAPASSGTVAAPIVFAAYGDPAQPKPTFVGSDALNSSSFALVAGTSTTYVMNTATPPNTVFDNHQFTINARNHEALIGGNYNDPATDINYVKATSGTWYYDAGNSMLYVNVGGALSGHTLTGARREDAVYSFQKSNLTFQNLDVTETANADAGYAFRVMQSTNIKILDCDASLAGKHHFGVIDSTGFLGQNLTATLAPPELGYGGASAYVMYSDASRAGLLDTSQWINDTWSNPNGAYPAFISHGDGNNAIGNILVQNMTSTGYGAGIIIYTTGPAERANILGGHIDGGLVEMDPDSSVMNGLTMTGATASVSIAGSHSFVQNCIFSGEVPNIFAGYNGVIQDQGHDNTIRFNTFSFTSPNGPAIALFQSDSNTHIYGNVFDNPQVISITLNGSNGLLDSNYNVFSSTPVFATGDIYHSVPVSYTQWQGLGRDLQSVIGNPKFTNAASGNFSLQAGSPAIDLYTQTPNSTVAITADYTGAPRPVGAGYDAGAYEAASVFTVTGTTGDDQIYLKLTSASPATVGVWLNTNHQGAGTPTQSIALTGSAISVSGLGGNDQLTADFSGGPVAPAGGLNFDGGTGTDTLVIIGTTGDDAISVNAAQVLVGIATCGFTNTEGVSVDPNGGADTISANAGSTTLMYDAAGYAAGLTINANASVTFATSPPGSGIQPRMVGALNIGASGIATVAAPLSHADRAVLVASTLSIASGGRLDLKSNDLIVKNGDVTTITSQLKSGLNVTNGYWNGSTGILSSSAAADGTYLTAISVLKNSINSLRVYGSGTTKGLFDGQDPGISDVLVKYTYFGDSDLSGRIDGSDYTKIDNGFNLKLTGWVNGDYNYDGVIDGSDYSLIDNAFNIGQLGPAGVLAEVASSAVTNVQKPAAVNARAGTAVPPVQALPVLPLGSAATKLFSDAPVGLMQWVDADLVQGLAKRAARAWQFD